MRDSDGASEFEFSQCFSKWGEPTFTLSVGCYSEAARKDIQVKGKKRDQKLQPREIKTYLLEPQVEKYVESHVSVTKQYLTGTYCDISQA